MTVLLTSISVIPAEAGIQRRLGLKCFLARQPCHEWLNRHPKEIGLQSSFANFL